MRVPSPTTAMAADGHAGTDFTSAATNAVGWIAGRDRRRGMQAAHGAGEGRARLERANHGAAGGVREVQRHDQAARGAGFGLPCRLAVADEGQLRRARGLQRSRARQFLLAVPFEGGAQPLGEFPDAHIASRAGRQLPPLQYDTRLCPSIRRRPSRHGPHRIRMPRIGPQTVIGEYCVVESDVAIGGFCRLEPYVYVKRWTTMGDRNEISAGTVLGTDPLDKAFTGERSYLRIGNGNIIREHYTISRGTQPESATADRRRQLHHDLRAHRAQLQDRQPDGHLQLRAGGGARRNRGPGFRLRRRGHPPVLEDRAAGHDRRQHAREPGRASVLPVRRVSMSSPGA